MQSLFALQQCTDANYQLGLDHITHSFEPDLNSMEYQDKGLLGELRKQASALYQQAQQDKQRKVSHENARVQEATGEALDLYHKQSKKDADFILKNTVVEAEKIYNHYVSMLGLAKALVETAEKDKKVSHHNFVANRWLRGLCDSPELSREILRLNVPWDRKPEYVRVWFRDVVRQDAEYLSYLDKKEPTLDDQKKFAAYFFKKVLLGKNIINDYFEEEVLRWAEDKDIVKNLIEKTVKSFHPDEAGVFSLFTLTVNWEEDRDFVELLYREASNLDDELKALVAQNTRNWEVERLPLTDRVIIEMAIAELINFPNIPIKVTINEYIELAKNYSTPKSSQFINGILDVIAKNLQEMGRVKKSGRGLIDNK
jgi:N utilization substance protein B